MDLNDKLNLFLDENEDKIIYKILVRHNEQFCLWPANRSNPEDWSDTGIVGSKIDCLNYISESLKQLRSQNREICQIRK